MSLCTIVRFQLLHTRVSEVEVEKFVHLIRTFGPQPQFLRFLIALCSCLGKAVERNQHLICEIVLQNPEHLSLLLQARVDVVTPRQRVHWEFEAQPSVFAIRETKKAQAARGFEESKVVKSGQHSIRVNDNESHILGRGAKSRIQCKGLRHEPSQSISGIITGHPIEQSADAETAVDGFHHVDHGALVRSLIARGLPSHEISWACSPSFSHLYPRALFGTDWISVRTLCTPLSKDETSESKAVRGVRRVQREDFRVQLLEYYVAQLEFFAEFFADLFCRALFQSELHVHPSCGTTLSY
jgi:hypothetical protein